MKNRYFVLLSKDCPNLSLGNLATTVNYFLLVKLVDNSCLISNEDLEGK
jgi:hypothetical protein